MKFSIVIPVLAEADIIDDLVTDLLERFGPDVEVLVVDGDPSGTTLAYIRSPHVIQLTAPKGRARQMNEGANRATGDILIFLHADTRLPTHALEDIRQLMADPEVKAGAFDLRFDSKRIIFKIWAWGASRRSRITRLPYGDQAIFIRRDVYESLGGYAPIPIMEDVDLMRRLKAAGYLIGFVDKPVVTSIRRYQNGGIVINTIRNWSLFTAYMAGASPARLIRFYR